MSAAIVADAASSEPLEPSRVARLPRLWPPVVLTILFWIVFAGVGLADVDIFVRFMTRFAALSLFAVGFLIWWLLSRVLPLADRLIVLAATAATIAAAFFLMHPSVRDLFMSVTFYAVPAMLTAWVAWLLMTGRGSRRVCRNGMIGLAALAWAWTCFVRMEGLMGQGEPEFFGRWAPTTEEQFLADRQDHHADRNPVASSADGDAQLVATDRDWPAFRGPERDGVVRGVTLRTDWNETPPKQLWSKRVGPGWSSIIAIGDRLFTQEQRGENEAVVCLNADTGEEIWSHEDKARFEEAMGGIGPRATPTFADGRLFTLGAKGLLNCFDAASGKLHWSRDITKDGDGKTPYWGFCSSPLVVKGKVIVFAGGGGEFSGESEDKPPAAEDASESTGPEPKTKKTKIANDLIAYDIESGEPAWQASAGSHSYSSAQLATFDGIEHVLFLNDSALDAIDAETGDHYWTYPTNAEQAMPALQPHKLGESDVLVTFNGRAGLVRATVSRGVDGWQVEDKWVSKDIKAFFNDFVCDREALYGFDGDIFCCIDLATGKRRWKGGRYGSGQVLLLADQPVLLVISEKGEAVLVAANPEKHEELGRFQAIHGKTWNNPTVVGNRLFVRNAEEMAGYEL